MAKEYSEQYNNENQAYKTIIREYVKSQLIDPLRMYPTTISDTLLYVIISRLEELYLYTIRFPEIVSPNVNRLDILQAIVDQFSYSIREGSDIDEQVDILENILSVYNKRGSLDTIENMWKYYGGNLPKDIKVKIPSYNIFRYSISRLSGKDVFQNNENYRSGVYEVVLNNSNYDISALKDFMLDELVAAGNRVYFTNSLYSLLTGSQASYKYDVREDTFIHTFLRNASHRSGMQWSGSGSLSVNNKSTVWSGRADLFFELTHLIYLGAVKISNTSLYDDLSVLVIKRGGFGSTVWDKDEGLISIVEGDVISSLLYNADLYRSAEYHRIASYTPSSHYSSIERYLNDSEGDHEHDGDRWTLTESGPYYGYFVLGRSLLGNEVS